MTNKRVVKDQRLGNDKKNSKKLRETIGQALKKHGVRTKPKKGSK